MVAGYGSAPASHLAMASAISAGVSFIAHFACQREVEVAKSDLVRAP